MSMYEDIRKRHRHVFSRSLCYWSGKVIEGGLSRRNYVVSSSQERGYVGHAHKPVDILSMSCISRRPRT